MSTRTSDRRLVTIVLVLIGALVVLPVLTMGFWAAGGGPMMGGSWGHMWGDGATAPLWFLLVGVVMQLLFLGVLLAVGYLVYRAVTRREARRDPALEELRMAYARGDLTEEEYESRRRDLEGE